MNLITAVMIFSPSYNINSKMPREDFFFFLTSHFTCYHHSRTLDFLELELTPLPMSYKPTGTPKEDTLQSSELSISGMNNLMFLIGKNSLGPWTSQSFPRMHDETLAILTSNKKNSKLWKWVSTNIMINSNLKLVDLTTRSNIDPTRRIVLINLHNQNQQTKKAPFLPCSTTLGIE